MSNHTEELLITLTDRLLRAAPEQPAWTDEMMVDACRLYVDYFSQATDGPDKEPPSSVEPAFDALLLTLWDAVVDWETELGDADPRNSLPLGFEANTMEQYYATVFSIFGYTLDQQLDPDHPRAFLREGLGDEATVYEPTKEDLRAVEAAAGIGLRRASDTDVDAKGHRNRQKLLDKLASGDMDGLRREAERLLRKRPGELLATHLLYNLTDDQVEADRLLSAWGDPPTARGAFSGQEAVDIPDYCLFEQTLAINDLRLGRLNEARQRIDRMLRLNAPHQMTDDSVDMYVKVHVSQQLDAGRVLPMTWKAPPSNADTPLASSALEEAFEAFRREATDEMAAQFAFIGEAMPTDLPHGTYQLKVTLKGIRPPIWRRIVVPADIPMGDLHEVLQATMGWYGGHLHAFSTNMGTYMPENDEFGDSYEGMRLNILMQRPKDKITYEYDFGDGWEHVILLEKVLPEPPDSIRCLKGKRACPPEDIGGIGGYQYYLQVLTKGPQDEEEKDLLAWKGADYDPEEFDLDWVNGRLAKLG